MKNVYKFLYILSIVLIICFVIIILIDYSNYDTFNNSVPFYACIIERGVEFIGPSIIIFIIGIFLKKKYRN